MNVRLFKILYDFCAKKTSKDLWTWAYKTILKYICIKGLKLVFHTIKDYARGWTEK